LATGELTQLCKALQNCLLPAVLLGVDDKQVAAAWPAPPLPGAWSSQYACTLAADRLTHVPLTWKLVQHTL
jgi:hypothetical protein